jgi:polyisoprenoid-binding protein YceI
MGAVFFVLGPAPVNSAAAVDHPAQPDPNRPAAKALPAPGTYKIDSDHSFAYFGARHHVVGLVRGRFDKVTGTINVAQNLAACSVDVTIDVSSISTQNTERDEDLLSPEYFDVKKFPAMKYRGRGIRRVSESS